MTTALAAAFRISRLGRIGDTDCEQIDESSVLAQPANAISSLGYAAVGAWIVWWGVRHARVRSADAWILGICVAITGMGSVDFHGPGTDAARFLHDGSIALTVLFMIAFDVGVLRAWRPTRTYVLFAVLGVLLSTPLLIEPDSSIPLTAIGVVVLVVVEVLALRSGERPLREVDGSRTRSVAYVVALSTLAAGGIVNALTRTDAPLCEPDSLLQGHALWHLLTAAAFAAWAVSALPRPVGVPARPDRSVAPA